MLGEFKKLMTARFFFTFATGMQAVLIGWQMYELTHDPLHLGLIGLTEAVPALSLALFAGYIVDRSRPLVIYRRVVMGSLLSGVVLWLSQLPQAGLAMEARIWGLFLASFITGTARAFSQPSIYATVPRIVPREGLARASAWMTSAMQTARIIGPGVGGLIFGWLGISFAAATVCVFLVIALASMLLIRLKLEPMPRGGEAVSVKEELLSGASYVFRHPILLPALSLDMISVMFGGVTALLPIYASDILRVGPKGLGLLRAIPSIGAVATSYWLTQRDLRAKAGPTLLACVAGFGLSILVFGLSRNFWLSVAALTLSGAFDSVSMVIRTAAVQLSSPASMRGRISAVNSIFIGSSNELGEFESGVAAKLLGTVPSVVLGAIVCLTTVAGAAVLSPTLRRMDLNALQAPEESSG